jgi:hypothetical protein
MASWEYAFAMASGHHGGHNHRRQVETGPKAGAAPWPPDWTRSRIVQNRPEKLTKAHASLVGCRH